MKLLHRCKGNDKNGKRGIYIALAFMVLAGLATPLQAEAGTGEKMNGAAYAAATGNMTKAPAGSVKVVSETGKEFPAEGSLWVHYDLGKERAGFKGSLMIYKNYFNLYDPSSLATESYLKSVYPLSLESGVFTGRIRYQLGAEQSYENNQWLYTYEVLDEAGAVIAQGDLGKYSPANTTNRVQVLVIGEEAGQVQKIKSIFPNSLILVKNEFDGEDNSFLRAYNTVFINHEEALALSKEQQERLLNHIAQGGRLIISSPKGHEKANFAETITGVVFTETGMSNLKDLANLLGSGSETLDFWQETGRTEAGSFFKMSSYGKGSILQLGFDPFAKDSKTWEVAEDKILETLLIQTSQNIKPMADHYALSNLAAQLPSAFIPSFGLMMIISALVLLVASVTGVYLIKVKRITNGMLISITCAAGLSLAVIWVSGMVSGYRGSLINQVGLNTVTEDGLVDSISYIGVKGNKSVSRLVLPADMEAWSYSGGYYTSRGTRVNTVDKDSLWELPRVDKWQVDIMAAKPKVDMAKPAEVLQNIKLDQGPVQGLIHNPSSEDWLSVILIIDGQWAALGDLAKGSTMDIMRQAPQFQSVRNIQGQYWGNPELVSANENLKHSKLDVTEYPSLLEMAFNQGNALEQDQLIYFTKSEDNAYSLQGEKAFKLNLSMNKYYFETGIHSAKNSYQLSDFQMVSGLVIRPQYALNNDIMLATSAQSATFICSWKPSPEDDGKAWEVAYSGERLGNLRIYNQKTGLWQDLRPKETLHAKEIKEQYQNREGELYFKIDSKSLYLTPADFTLSSKGVE